MNDLQKDMPNLHYINHNQNYQSQYQDSMVKLKYKLTKVINLCYFLLITFDFGQQLIIN